MNWETLLTFGDSITFGARSYLGYPEFCGNLLSSQLDKSWHVINHATNGFTTMDLVRSINPLISEYKSNYPSLVTVMIGTNDVKMKIAPEDFRIAYEQLSIKLKLLAVNNNIILLKIPPLTKKVLYPYTFSMNQAVDSFNEIIDSIANKSKLRIHGFNFRDEDFYDGVHLNEEGCRNIAQQLCDLILKDKGLESTPGMS